MGTINIQKTILPLLACPPHSYDKKLDFALDVNYFPSSMYAAKREDSVEIRKKRSNQRFLFPSSFERIKTNINGKGLQNPHFEPPFFYFE